MDVYWLFSQRPAVKKNQPYSLNISIKKTESINAYLPFGSYNLLVINPLPTGEVTAEVTAQYGRFLTTSHDDISETLR